MRFFRKTGKAVRCLVTGNYVYLHFGENIVVFYPLFAWTVTFGRNNWLENETVFLAIIFRFFIARI